MDTSRLLCLSFAVALAAACEVSSYEPGPGGGPAGGPDAGGQQAVCTPENAASTVLSANCGGCHGAASPAAGLDLVSVGVRDRLIDTASSACAGKVLVVSGNPTGSYLMEKISGIPTCGEQMPKGRSALSAEQVSCVSDWIGEVLPGTTGGDGSGDGGGGADGGGNGGGGGGSGW